ncbi:carotenoid oxygenase family protein [Phormidesmis sp. 146-35]
MTSSLTKKTWAKAILHTATGFEPTPLAILSGAIPSGLRGSLYRNGPGRLERGGQPVGHWFDGDGAVLGVHFRAAGATGVYRYVQSVEFQEEERAGRFIYGGYGMMPPGAIWERFKATKNAGNTSVLALPDRLLALWEGGHPYSLDLETLETRGFDDLGGLPKSLPFSAHPKRDPQTGDIYNFGVSFGKTATLNLYRISANGTLKQRSSTALEGYPLLHDFVMAGKYLIFFVPPTRLNPLPVLARLKSFSDAFSWQPERGTQILVVDRDTLKVVSQGETAPWYQWHFGNGYLDTDGNAVVSVVKYADFNTNQYLKEIATGEIQTIAKPTLWQIRIDPHSATVLEITELLDRPCEFPIVKPQEVGQPARYTYLSIHRLGADLGQEVFGAIARFEQSTGALVEANLGDNHYPTEPIYAPDSEDLDRGWILTIVYDGDRDRSEVWIFDSDRLDDSPVCRLALPEVIPLGFHGTWKPAV